MCEESSKAGEEAVLALEREWDDGHVAHMNPAQSFFQLVS